MNVKEVIKRNLSRSAAGRNAHKQMHRRENVIGKRIYYGPGIRRKQEASRKRELANARARFKHALDRRALEERKKSLQKNSQ